MFLEDGRTSAPTWEDLVSARPRLKSRAIPRLTAWPELLAAPAAQALEKRIRLMDIRRLNPPVADERARDRLQAHAEILLRERDGVV
jgi:hypothetical protein